MYATSRPVDPNTGRPIDFDHRQTGLDLPPRRPPQQEFSPDAGVPGWLRALKGTGWLVGLIVWITLAVAVEQLAPDSAPEGIHTWIFLLAAALAVGLHVYAATKGNAAHNQHVMLHTGAVDRYYQDSLAHWTATRPLRRVALSENPAATLAQVMAERRASLVFGVVPDTQELATAGRQSSVLVLAPSQMGKTTCLAAPMLTAHYGPAVVTSVKRDLVDWTIRARSSRGQIWIFDPSGEWTDTLPPGARIAYWTPLWAVRSWEDAQLMAASMIKATPVGRGENGVHWTESAEMCMAPLLLAAAVHNDLTMSTVLDWITTRRLTEPRAILEYVRDDADHPLRHDARLALRELNALIETQGDQRDGIFQTVVTVVRAYNSKALDLHADRQNFDPAVFVHSTDTIYVASASAKQAKLAPVIVALIDAIQQAAYARDAVDPFHRSDRPSLLMCLDEAANVAPMRELPRYLSEAGGQGVQMVVVLQSLGQAEKVWPAEAKAFLDYFSTVVAFGGETNDATLEALSVLAGDYDRQYVSNTFSQMTSAGFSNSTSTSFLNPTTYTSGSNRGTSQSVGTSHSVHKERRLTKGDIASLPPRHALVVTKHERSARIGNFSILELTPCYESPWSVVDAKSRPRLGSPSVVDLRDAQRPVPKLPPVENIVDVIEHDADPAGVWGPRGKHDGQNWRFAGESEFAGDSENDL